MKNIRMALCLALLAGLLSVLSVRAQQADLTLSFSRDFGYSSGGGDIQGLFTVRAAGPDNLLKVVFYMDDQVLGEAGRPPFCVQFNTDNYPLGSHRFYARGTTSDGRELTSRTVSANFVSAETGLKAAGQIAIPVLALVFGAMLVAAVVPLVTGRKTVDLPHGTQRSYPLGGAICPKCGRPFALHLYGLNLPGSKFDRCPYCGKWSLVRLAALEKLRAAEQAELANAVSDGSGQVQGLTEEEKLKKELDESRYHDI